MRALAVGLIAAALLAPLAVVPTQVFWRPKLSGTVPSGSWERFGTSDKWYLVATWRLPWDTREDPLGVWREQIAWHLVMLEQAALLLLAGGIIAWRLRRSRSRQSATAQLR